MERSAFSLHHARKIFAQSIWLLPSLLLLAACTAAPLFLPAEAPQVAATTTPAASTQWAAQLAPPLPRALNPAVNPAAPTLARGSASMSIPTMQPAPELALLPTVTPTPALVTPNPETVPQVKSESGPAAATSLAIEAPPEAGVPLDSFKARGLFTTTTRFAGGAETIQRGEYQFTATGSSEPERAASLYELTTQRDSDPPDSITLYQLPIGTAVTFNDGTWLVNDPAQESSFAKALQPVVRLPEAFLRIIDQAEIIGLEMRSGQAVTHYRLAGAENFMELLGPILTTQGSVIAFQFDCWVVPDPESVLAYAFQASLTGVPTLDLNFIETQADQTVAWSYERFDTSSAITVSWPTGVPLPGEVYVPGMEPFPLPPNTILLDTYAGISDLLSQEPVSIVATYYQAILGEQGWKMEGAAGLYTYSKGDDRFTMILTKDESTAGTRITIIVE
jgi:hypothetical protein